MFDRRSILMSTIAAIAYDARACQAFAAGAGPLPAYAAAARLADSSFAVVLLSADGAVIRQIPLSARGHDVAVDRNTGNAVAFARRPGVYAVAFNLRVESEPVVFTAIHGRHFFGHGAFSNEGRLLYASENDIAGSRGVIGVYDAGAGFRRIGEYQSYGVGPHEIILMRDGRTLAIANGGLDTVPDAGRENINLDSMQPSLTFVDARTGDLIARHELPEGVSRLSLRHIAADRFGGVWFGGQWEGALADAPALIGSVSLNGEIRLVEDNAAPGIALKGYIGSVATGAGGSIIAASAPKAGRVVYIDCETGRLIGGETLRDVCGLAALGDAAFALTSGFGVLRTEVPPAKILSEAQVSGVAFDNHLRRTG